LTTGGILFYSGFINPLVLAFKWSADTHAVATEFCNMALLTHYFLGNQRIKTQRNYSCTSKLNETERLPPNYTTTQPR
jgi:hypothetical protein